MKSVVGIFEQRSDAERAAERLVALGVRRENVNVLTPGGGNGAAQAAKVTTTDTEQEGVGTVLGGVVGASAGASLGTAVALLVPGVGPVVAIGWAAMTLLGLAGAVGGAVAGHALEDALSSGLPKDELFLYEDALRKGHTVVIALADTDEQAAEARRVMCDAGAEDIDTARERWWLGIRPRDGTYEEPGYRRGVEAALHPDVRGKSWENAEPHLADRYADVYRDEAFRRGYDRGRAHHEQWLQEHLE